MLPLDEMMLQAQNGAIIDLVARQFDLTRDQTVAALQALMPAFSQGLKRSAATPEGFAPFVQALAGGDHVRYMNDMARAFTGSGTEEGNAILGHLFGSKELSRAVAEYAAHATGIGQETLKRMLPSLATLMMGGLYQQSTGQMRGSAGRGESASANPVADLMEQWTRLFDTAARAPSASAFDPFDNPFARMMREMFAASGAQSGDTRSRGGGADPHADNPLFRAFQDMMKAGMTPANADADRQSEPPPEPEPEPEKAGNPYEELFGQMFETTRAMQKDYQKGMESIFDRYLQDARGTG